MNNYYWSIICVDAFLLGMLIGMVAYTFALIRKYAIVESYQEQAALYHQMTNFQDQMHHYHAVPYA